MDLEKVCLPNNNTLPAKWYDGKYRIESLTFTEMAIVAIEPNAFNSDAFLHLEYFNIENTIHFIEYHAQMFNGLQLLRYFGIVENNGHRIHPMQDFLDPLSEFLDEFYYKGDVGTDPVLTNLFGRQQLLRLEMIGFTCHRNSRTRFLAAQNFTGLMMIKRLSIGDCGIETIQIGTFDQLCDTLELLILVKNPLLKLNLNMFRSFLDVPLRNVVDTSKKLRLSEYLSHVNCTMDFYRLRNATIIAMYYSSNNFGDLFCQNDVHAAHEIESRQQIVHPKRWHLEHTEVFKYTFPKFHLRFNAANRTLMVNQSNPDDSYRLLIWAIGRKASIGEWRQRKSASIPWIKQNVHCYRSNRSIENISLPNFNQNIIDEDNSTPDMVAACIIYITYRKQSVPFHCATMIMPQNSQLHFGYWIGLACFLILHLAISSILGIASYDRFVPHRARETSD